METRSIIHTNKTFQVTISVEDLIRLVREHLLPTMPHEVKFINPDNGEYFYHDENFRLEWSESVTTED